MGRLIIIHLRVFLLTTLDFLLDPLRPLLLLDLRLNLTHYFLAKDGYFIGFFLPFLEELWQLDPTELLVRLVTVMHGC